MDQSQSAFSERRKYKIITLYLVTNTRKVIVTDRILLKFSKLLTECSALFSSEFLFGHNFELFLFLPNRDIVELLLSYEASCNSADEKGSSPLHLVCTFFPATFTQS